MSRSSVSSPNSLKLAAFDEDDLLVISTQLQDALLNVGDITFLAQKKSLVLLLRRFDWEDAEINAGGPFRRVLCGLSLSHVVSIRSKRISRDDPQAVLSLLSIAFKQNDPPSGILEIVFSGGGLIAAEVECLEAKLEDVGLQFSSRRKPEHGAG